MGACLSSILLRYEGSSIARAFAISAVTFLPCRSGVTPHGAAWPQWDHFSYGTVGLILASIAQIIIHSSGLNSGSMSRVCLFLPADGLRYPTYTGDLRLLHAIFGALIWVI